MNEFCKKKAFTLLLYMIVLNYEMCS